MTTIPVEYGVRKLLTDDAAVAALIGTRIYPTMRAEATALPAMVYSRVGAEHEHHMTAASGIQTATVRIDCYASTYLGAKDLAEKARHALQAYRGTQTVVSNVVIKRLHLVNDNDGYERPAHGEGIGVYVVSQDWAVGYADDVPTFA